MWNFSTRLARPGGLEYLQAGKNLRRLCGWERAAEIPSESTFSRVFADFSLGQLPQTIHEAMVKKQVGNKLAGHISRDATAIEGRQKPVKTETAKKGPDRAERRRGRPKKGEVVAAREPKRLELQPHRSLEENLADLPRHCNVGTKRDSKGHTYSWVGYKLHLDTMDGDIPVSALLTSASLHDSQAAIPLAQMSRQRVTNLYDLMDSAYDAPQIRDFSRQLGHVPIVDQNPRRGPEQPMEPAHAERFKERSSAERVNANLKDNYGGWFVRVRGPAKVMAHLMFGLIALTASQLFRLLE